jgi:hypothetical protein
VRPTARGGCAGQCDTRRQASPARRKRIKIFFKGGWRSGITHQVALLERRGRRVALAVLTSGSPSMAYGVETVERIAARALP